MEDRGLKLYDTKEYRPDSGVMNFAPPEAIRKLFIAMPV